MAARIYIVTSGGDPIVTSGGDRIYTRELLARYMDLCAPLKARGIRYFDFHTNLLAKIVRYLDFHQDFEAFARSGYFMFARNRASGVVVNLGFIAAEGPLQLSGVALADGDYEIELRLQGYFWEDTRSQRRFPLRIVGGEIVTPLPTPRNLIYGFTLTETRLAWIWQNEPGTETPDDFAIWTSATDPVDTSGAPGYTVAATSPGEYSATIAQAALLYIAVAARKGATKGPLALLTIPAPPADLDAPAGQFVRFP